MTVNNNRYLPGEHSRARFLRLDAATILKRFYRCERSLIVSQSAWLAGIAALEVKMTLPRFTWQDTLTAHALRERVFELRYPRRMLEIGEDAPLVEVFDESINAPNAPRLSSSRLLQVFKPALSVSLPQLCRLCRRPQRRADPPRTEAGDRGERSADHVAGGSGGSRWPGLNLNIATGSGELGLGFGGATGTGGRIEAEGASSRLRRRMTCPVAVPLSWPKSRRGTRASIFVIITGPISSIPTSPTVRGSICSCAAVSVI